MNVLITFPRSRRGRTVKRFLIFCVLLASGATALYGQSAFDGFDPNANGAINVVVVQPDGKILIGGDFTTLAPNDGAAVTRNRIARLNPDGTLDTGFNPNASSTVYAIAVQADGKILVGGDFNGANSIGGQTRNRIARLDATTGAADSFNPDASGGGFAAPIVYTIAVQADGKILAGGQFTSIGGATRNRIARLDPTTGAADSFNPNASSTIGGAVYTIVVQSNGKILAGGTFNAIGGQTRLNIARLDAASGAADSFNPNADNTVYAIAVQPDGKVLAGGNFTNVGGVTRNFMARLDSATGAVDAFNPSSSGDVDSIVVQADGKILVGGVFTTIGGATRNRIARLSVGGAADSFNPNADFFVRSVAVQADGKILAGGEFSIVGGQTRNRIARLETDGGLDQKLNLSIVGSKVLATAVQPDGKILIGGVFTSVLGVARNHIARVNRDGTLDAGFNPNTTGSTPTIRSIALQSDGKILVGGNFTGIGGQTRKSIARLDGTTGLADSFDPNPIGPAIIPTVYSIAVQADGKILVGGFFDSIGGQPRPNIARLDATTGLADSFNPNADGDVFSIAVQADGKILLGGSFSHIGPEVRNRIARVDPATGALDSFNPDASNQVLSISVQTDGRILVGGAFSFMSGQTRNRLARVDSATGALDSFNPDLNNTVYTLASQADGKILVGGDFTQIGAFSDPHLARLDGTSGAPDLSFNANSATHIDGVTILADGKILVSGDFTGIAGQVRNRFARLTSDRAALQNLAATPSTITWTRAGSSPQFTRVTFEYSTDNVSYTLLGNGTAAGSNWTLTGLNLPTGQNIYIRARGFYRGGYLNGSESIQESVRNVFLEPIIAPSSVVSRKTHGPDPDPLKTFDINLPLTGPVGIECRRNTGADTTGPNLGRDHEVVITFPSPVTVGGTSVTSNDMADTPSATFSVSSNVVTVYLHNIANASRRLTINLLNTSDGTIVSVPMGVLLADTNGTGGVNNSDITQTKGQSGAVAGPINFRTDVTVNGFINNSDITTVKGRSGTGLP